MQSSLVPSLQSLWRVKELWSSPSWFLYSGGRQTLKKYTKTKNENPSRPWKKFRPYLEERNFSLRADTSLYPVEAAKTLMENT